MRDQSARFPGAMVGLAWSIGYFALCLPIIVLSALVGHLVGQATWPWISPVFHSIAWIAGVLFVTWLIRVRVNHASWDGMALPSPQILRLLMGGVAGSAAILAASVFEYKFGWLHVVRVDLSPHLGMPKLSWIALALLPSLGVGITEELAFRGYVFQTLAERTRVWIAGVLMAIVFAGWHFSLSGFDIGFVLSVVVLSLMFLTLRFATGSLWFGIGFHGAWDWTQTYAVGLSTTGMTGYDPAVVQIRQTGPALWVGGQQAIEGGLLFLIIATIVLVITLAYASRTGTMPPWMASLKTNGNAIAD